LHCYDYFDDSKIKTIIFLSLTNYDIITQSAAGGALLGEALLWQSQCRDTGKGFLMMFS